MISAVPYIGFLSPSFVTGSMLTIFGSPNTQTGSHGSLPLANTTTHVLTSVPAGSLLLVSAADESDSSGGAISIADGVGLTWSTQGATNYASVGRAAIFTAPFVSGGSITITVTFAAVGGGPGGQPQCSSVAYVITGQESAPGGNSVVTASATPNVPITTTKSNSIVFMVYCDWDATANSNLALRDGATLVLNDNAGAGNYEVSIHSYVLKPSIGTYNEGWTLPTISAVSVGDVLYEVRTA